MISNWQTICNNEFLPKLEDLELAFENNNKNDFMNSLYDLYKVAIRMLSEYLAFCGIYPSTILEIIKAAYYNEIIDNGQLWINILCDIKNPNRNFFKEKYINMFKDLKTYLDKEMEFWDV